ncbi:MAG: hypothetical protein WBQ89_26140 [Candidatus Acidiferrum sp.]
MPTVPPHPATQQAHRKAYFVLNEDCHLLEAHSTLEKAEESFDSDIDGPGVRILISEVSDELYFWIQAIEETEDRWFKWKDDGE